MIEELGHSTWLRLLMGEPAMVHTLHNRAFHKDNEQIHQRRRAGTVLVGLLENTSDERGSRFHLTACWCLMISMPTMAEMLSLYVIRDG